MSKITRSLTATQERVLFCSNFNGSLADRLGVEVFLPTAFRSIDLPYLVLSRLSVSGRLLRYVSRMVKVTTLAPDIERAILDETVLPDLTLFDLGVYAPAVWKE